MPIGNGRLGAMVYGETGRETMQSDKATNFSPTALHDFFVTANGETRKYMLIKVCPGTINLKKTNIN